MTPEEKKNAITSAMEFKKWDNGKEGYIISNTCDKELKDILLGIIYDENIGGTNDLSYEIAHRACGAIEDIELDDLKDDDFDLNEAVGEVANVYIWERLAYLNTKNQDEITEEMRSFDCDIQTACAIWYNDIVLQAVETLRKYIIA